MGRDRGLGWSGLPAGGGASLHRDRRRVLATAASVTALAISLSYPSAAQSPAAASAAAGPMPTMRPPAETCEPAKVPFDAGDVHLTGVWSADDGGVYYLRQVGDKVFWNGMSDFAQVDGEIGRDWNNVAMGTLDGLLLDVEFADVPRGNIYGNGTLSLRAMADPDGNLQLLRFSGDFGATTFTPCQPSVRTLSGFARPLSFTVPFGSASGFWPGVADLAAVWSQDVPDSGMTFWVVGPGWSRYCPTATDWVPLAPGYRRVRGVPPLAS